MKIHSRRTVEELFSGKPIQLNLYQQIREYIASIGPVKINVTKTQVSFANKRQFAWVWLPMEWDKKRPPHCVVLSFALGKQVKNPHIDTIVEPYPGRWMHHVIIKTKSDLNSTVQGWLKEAYDFGNSH